jgi:hypothetical protein
MLQENCMKLLRLFSVLIIISSIQVRIAFKFELASFFTYHLLFLVIRKILDINLKGSIVILDEGKSLSENMTCLPKISVFIYDYLL